MYLSYFKYFARFIIFSKNRQRLLILAVAGLILSSFALIVLQSTMGGLQNKLMERSKSVLGRANIIIDKNIDTKLVIETEKMLKNEGVEFLKEYEIELMIRYKSFLIPAIAHGVDLEGRLPSFLSRDDLKSGIIPMEMAYKIELLPPDTISLVSPSHVDSLFADIPRSQSVTIERAFNSDVPEVDMYHIWVRLPLIQNLIQEKVINRFRIYSNADFLAIKKLLPNGLRLRTWEDENNSLVWALNLESTVMVFLFASMSLLVSLCITSGLLIFFNKIKNDLSSFWILGASLKKINHSTALFLHLLTFGSIVFGLLLGIISLWIFVKIGPNVMPDVFVDRKIPVLITFKGIMVSVLIPYFISWIFIHFSLVQFKKEYNLLDHVRSVC